MNNRRAKSLDELFHPRSIAIVGVSTAEDSWVNKNFLKSLLDFNFPGKIYPVNPRGGEVMGLQLCPSLKDIPGPVDYALCALPAAQAEGCVLDCIGKGVKVLVLYTAGFSEKDEGGAIKEKEMAALARAAGLRLIGPNCLGLYYPQAHISYSPFFPREAGKVGYLSQSGGNSAELVEMVAYRGVRFSKVISYGNACDINETDLMEYLAWDDETRVILAYIEGLRGNSFASVLREAASRKPAIILKGGRTEAGTRATYSHTGSIAGNYDLWSKMCQQAGAILVENLQDMADLLVAFYYLPPLAGANVAVVGIGGGASVQTADECERAGLKVPPFPEEIQRKLKEFIPEAGTSVRNPLDSAVSVIWDASVLLKTLKLVASCPDIDLLLLQPPVQLGLYHFGEEALMEAMKAVVQANKEINKPIAVVLRHSASPQTGPAFFNLQSKLIEGGLPVYPDLLRATRTLGRFYRYYLNQDKLEPKGINSKVKSLPRFIGESPCRTRRTKPQPKT